ncbi:Protein of unknown function [Gryllus bimaculatus]|nr:Protein of unknown function [Gryllus bimaculatus]
MQLTTADKVNFKRNTHYQAVATITYNANEQTLLGTAGRRSERHPYSRRRQSSRCPAGRPAPPARRRPPLPLPLPPRWREEAWLPDRPTAAAPRPLPRPAPARQPAHRPQTPAPHRTITRISQQAVTGG